MKGILTVQHRQRFDEIKKNLSVLGCSEGNFVKVELLFFEALTISKDYGDDVQTNVLRANLKQLQQEQYERTKAPTRKQAQREILIRQFIVGLKKALSLKMA